MIESEETGETQNESLSFLHNFISCLNIKNTTIVLVVNNYEVVLMTNARSALLE